MQHLLHLFQRMDEDLGRYGSAAGWEPKDPWKKQRDKARKEQEKELGPFDSMLAMRPASQWITRACREKPPAELYGPLWREGEVAVLFGDHGAGKSILAVQLAECIATGRNATVMERALLSVPPEVAGGVFGNGIQSPKSKIQNRKVLYVDFQRTEAQWTERYSAPSPIPGKLPVKCQFKFQRAGINWTNVDLDAYGRDPVKFALHSIFHKIEDSGAKVVIIDDILLGGANALGRKGVLRTMQTLKMWAATEGISILVLSSSSSPAANRRLSSPVSRLLSSCVLADSVFSIAPSTFGPDYRYVKSVRSPIHHSSFDIHHSPDVLSYQLNSTSPVSGLASPVFHYLGPSTESDHLRDYAAEAVRTASGSDRVNKRRLRRLARESAVEMLMSKEYWRYLDE